jgi:hypothetical protein
VASRILWAAGNQLEAAAVLETDNRTWRIADVAQAHADARRGIFHPGLMAAMIAELVCVISL